MTVIAPMACEPHGVTHNMSLFCCAFPGDSSSLVVAPRITPVGGDNQQDKFSLALYVPMALQITM